MNDVWCRRLVIAAVVWIALAVALQIVVSLAFR
jgi:hypothetical protein